MGFGVVPPARLAGHGEELLFMFFETRSAYTGGFVEGVYLRIDDGADRVARGTCVAPTSSRLIEEHWMAGEV